MKIYKIGIILMALFGLSSNVFAVESSGQIARIYPTGDNIYFSLKNDSCITTSGEYYKINKVTQAQSAAEWFSMLLAAANTGKEINVAISGSCNDTGHRSVLYIYQNF